MHQLVLIAFAIFALTAAPAAAQVSATLEAESDRSFGNPHDLVLSPDGTRLYVADVNNDAVKVLDPQTLKTIGILGASELSRPHDIDIDAAGNLYVSDPGNNRIQMLDDALRMVGEIGGERYKFNEPKYFTITESGWIIVTDEFNNQVKILNQDHEIVGVIGTGTSGLAPNAFNQPEGAEVRGDTLWVSDTHNGRITRFRREGISTTQ